MTSSPISWHLPGQDTHVAAVDAAVLKLCLLRGECVLNLLPPEGFQKAGIEQRRNKLQVVSRVVGVWPRPGALGCLLCSQLDLGCGPGPQVCLHPDLGTGMEGEFRVDPGAFLLLVTCWDGGWGHVSRLSPCFIASLHLLLWECSMYVCIDLGSVSLHRMPGFCPLYD